MLRRRWWLAVAAFGISISFVIGGLPAGAAGVSVPTVGTTLPTTQVPVPPVSTPPVTVPVPAPVPAPPVTAPSVTTPPVKTPAPVPPAASTPSVPTPAGTVPSASAPTPSSARGTSAGSDGSGSGSTSAPDGASAAAASTPGSGAAARSVASHRSSGSGGPGHTAQASGRHGSSVHAPKRDRELRQAVVHLQGCLARVPRAERRVLVLRAGIGTARTRSRAEVARITGLRRARVARLERRGLRHLRALGRAGACGIAPGGGETALAGLPPVSDPTQNSGPAGHGGVLAERDSHAARTPVQSEAEGTAKPAARLPIARPEISSTNRFDLAVVFIPLAVVAFVLVMIREARRTT
jgi:hypothetical protein